METKSKFDGLIVKFNDISKSGHSDCSLCCLSCEKCDECPLLSHYYFEKPLKPSFDCSKISSKDKKYLFEVITDLRWLAKHLEDSISLGVVFHSTIDMVQSSLSLDSHILSKVSTFDN